MIDNEVHYQLDLCEEKKKKHKYTKLIKAQERFALNRVKDHKNSFEKHFSHLMVIWSVNVWNLNVE